MSLETWHLYIEEEKTRPLKERDYKDPTIIVMDRAAYNQGKNAQFGFTVSGGGYCSDSNRKRSRGGLLWDSTDIPGNAIGSLCATDYKFPQQQQIIQAKVVIEEMDNGIEYVVRRLTPLECCRLQGFPDEWGSIDEKEDFTEEEHRFWLDVKQTYDRVNGREKKDYTKDQLLKWYNKLHTDSAEYKMWGNGIALPCALYVMQGIVDELRREDEE